MEFCPKCNFRYLYCVCGESDIPTNYKQTSADKPPVVTEPRSDVVVKALGEGYKAYLATDSAKWEYGESSATAIGRLVVSHADELGIKIAFQPEDK